MKEETLNVYEKAVNIAIDYINDHLYDSLSIKVISEQAAISGFHFHRIFKVIVGENIGEYITRLRLEDIAQKLRMTKTSLSDIALVTGYASKHALSKAFKRQFNMSPSAYRNLPKNMCHFQKDGKARKEIVLNPQIKNILPKKIIYVRIIDPYGSDSYAKAWKKVGLFALDNNIINSNTEYLGLCFDDPTITSPENCRFYACITTDKDINPNGAIGVQFIQGGTFAVFTMQGSYSQLIDYYYNIYIRWLPESGYKLRKMLAFEKYINSPTTVEEKDLLTEIYIPIKKVKNL